ncbi:MAG: hypothetical protein ACKVT0_13340 [Planctomycetaceae bacterium]
MPTNDWKPLIEFLGYGSSEKCANILFLGLEEKAPEKNYEQNLKARLKFERIEDLREAHERKLGPAADVNPFAKKGNPVRQWNTAARFSLAIEGHPDWNKRTEWRRYWRDQLGRRSGNTFLMECCPIPRPNGNWHPPETPQLPSDDEVWAKRCPLLQDYLDKCPPKYVIAYGIQTKDKASELFSIPDDGWTPIPNVDRPASIARNDHTCIAHVGFFGRHYFVNYDIPKIVAALKRQCE